MPNFFSERDKEDKLYAWNDPGLNMMFQIGKSYTQLMSALENDELARMRSRHETLIDPKMKTFGSFDGRYEGTKKGSDFHGFKWENNHAYLRNKQVSVQQYLEDGDLEAGRTFLGEVKEGFLKCADSLPKDPKYDKIREFYRVHAFAADPAEGNLLEAYGRNPYMVGLCDLAGGAPKFIKKGYDACIDGLNNQTDSKGNPQPVFDIVMDMMNAFEPELKVEYHRQKMAREGWDDRSEARYLAELKAAHEETLKKFDKMWDVDDYGQYDEYLDNEFDHTLGRRLQVERDITGSMGNIRGELKAIENGWASDELQVLGFVGQLEAIIKRKKIRSKDDPEALKELEALDKDFKALQKDVWDKKIEKPQDKIDVIKGIKTFWLDHIDDPVVGHMLVGAEGHSEIFNASMEAATDAANKEIFEEGKLKNLNNEALDSMDADAVQKSAAIIDLKLKVAMIADEAKEKLAALEKMTKQGHKDGKEYIAMHDALKTVSELDPSNASLERLDQVLGKLEGASATYGTTHSGWFKATKGYGEDRLNMSKSLKAMAVNARREFTEGSAGLDRNKTFGNMDDETRASLRRIDREKKVRETSAADLEKKLGANAGKQKEDFAKKRMEIEQAQPGFKLGNVNGQPVKDPVNKQ